MSKKKKIFPIKYMRKGLFTDEDLLNEKQNSKVKRRVIKPKISVHIKTGKGKNK